MTEFNLPELRINKIKPQDDIKQLLQKIKPQWDEKDIKLQPMTGGYSSNIFLCFAKSMEEAVIIRIIVFERSTAEYELEMKILQHLSSIGHFAKLHAKFQNGYCYQYIEGKSVVNSLNQTGVITTEILWHVSKEMAFIHSIKLNDIKYENSSYFQCEKLYMENATWTIDHPLAPTKERLIKELSLVENYVKTLGSRIVHCHGDLHSGNIIWNVHQKKITFVDWENTCVGYQYQDIAHYLISLWICGITNTTKKGFVSLPENYESIFLKYYYDNQRELKNENFKVENLKQFEELIEKFKLVTILMYVTACLTEPVSVNEWSGDRNFLLESCVEKYLKLKRDYLCKDDFET